MNVDVFKEGVLLLSKKTFVLVAVAVAVLAVCLISLHHGGGDADAEVESTIDSGGLKYTVASFDEMTVQVTGYEDRPVNLTIPDTIVIDGLTYKVVSIGKDAFKGCESLKSLTLGANVIEIGESAFEGCESLSQLDLNKLQKIEKKAFKNVSSIPDLVLPDTMVDVGLSAFENVVLDTLSVPVSLPLGKGYRSESQFKDCKGLVHLIITKGSDGVCANYEVGNDFSTTPWMLCNGTVKDLVIEEGVKSISVFTFIYMRALESIDFPSTLESIGGSAFSQCPLLKSIVIPESVSYIGEMAFCRCTGLTELTIPISLNAVVSNYSPVFEHCKKIETVTLTKGMVTNKGTGAKQENGIGHDYGDNTYTPWSLSKKSFTTLIVADGVTVIGDYTFKNCSSLTSVTLPDSLTRIKHSAFEGCKSLKDLKIPDSVTRLGRASFKNCTGLTELTVPISLNTVVKNNDPAFKGCKGIEKVTLTAGTGNGHGYGDNKYTPWRISKGSLKTLVVEDGVKTIGKNTFKDCVNSMSISLPDSLEGIGGSAFKGFEFYGTDGETRIDASPENLRGRTFAGESGRMVEQ